MTINRELMLAIMAMDSYNRGYRQGIKGLSDSGQLGHASVKSRRDLLIDDIIFENWQASGFYALAYDMTDVAGFDPGSTVIAYRGSDNFLGQTTFGSLFDGAFGQGSDISWIDGPAVQVAA